MPIYMFCFTLMSSCFRLLTCFICSLSTILVTNSLNGADVLLSNKQSLLLTSRE